MDIRIIARPLFTVPLTSEHITVLSTLAQHHYDGRCKAAGEKDGFLAQWARILRCHDLVRASDDETPTMTVTFDEIDTCLKILEVTELAYSSRLLNVDLVMLCGQLRRDLRGAASLANSKYSEWQAVYTVSSLA